MSLIRYTVPLSSPSLKIAHSHSGSGHPSGISLFGPARPPHQMAPRSNLPFFHNSVIMCSRPVSGLSVPVVTLHSSGPLLQLPVSPVNGSRSFSNMYFSHLLSSSTWQFMIYADVFRDCLHVPPMIYGGHM